MAVRVVHIHGYGKLEVITYAEYLKGDWQYEGSDEFTGYDVAFSYDRMKYACVKIPYQNEEDGSDVRY